MDRRDALRWLALAAGTGWLEGIRPDRLVAWGQEVHARARGAEGQELRALDAHASRTVVAAAERIIPATDTPGATDAGVSAFIDRMLADWYPPADRARFLEGLAELDRRARPTHGRDFADCTEGEQHTLLIALDEERAADPDDHWFAMLKFLTVWGYCTSEVAQRRTLRAYPLPVRYDGCAPYPAAAGGDGSA
jgi:hypothetical protein